MKNALGLDPLPEREEDKLLEAVSDIIHNGGRIPQDVSNELIMAGVIKISEQLGRTVNVARANAIANRLIVISISILYLIVAVVHADEIPILSNILDLF